MAIQLPSSPNDGDLYEYDGVQYQYIASQSKWIVYTSTDLEGVDPDAIDRHLVPEGNVIYDLGTSTRRWRDLYLSGNTLVLGLATISSSSNGSIVLPEGSSIGNTGPIQAGTGNAVPVGGGGNKIFFNNDTVVTEDYIIPANTNSMSAGPLEIANGVVVTISNNSAWTIV